jgi:hypothetical protein
MAVGQVDVMVGLPTFNNAETVQPIARAIHAAFARYFPRLRTVLIHSDGGSTDGTPDLVRSAASEDPAAAAPLRTVHRIVTPHARALGKGNALRTIFAAADLSQARALAVIDPDVTTVTPEWIAALVMPVIEQGHDYVAPVYARGRFDGAMVTQIIRPMFRAVYRAPLREPVSGEFGCSSRFSAHCLAQDAWDRDFTRFGIDIWLASEAVARRFRVAQAVLGPHAQAHGAARMKLRDLIEHVAGAFFTCMDLHHPLWTASDDAPAVPVFGEIPPLPLDDPADMAESIEEFRSAMADLGPILGDVLDPSTQSGLMAALRAPGTPALSDELWARVLGDFAIGWRRGRVNRDHLIQTLIQLYLGRVAVFVQTHRRDDAEAVERAHEALCAACERMRPAWVAQWAE